MLCSLSLTCNSCTHQLGSRKASTHLWLLWCAQLSLARVHGGRHVTLLQSILACLFFLPAVVIRISKHVQDMAAGLLLHLGFGLCFLFAQFYWPSPVLWKLVGSNHHIDVEAAHQPDVLFMPCNLPASRPSLAKCRCMVCTSSFCGANMLLVSLKPHQLMITCKLS